MSTANGAFRAVGGIALFLGSMLAIVLLAVAILHGGLWVSAKLYPILVSISGLTLAVVVFILLPNAVWSSTPRFAGNGLIIASYVFGACMWTWSFLLAYAMWGWVGLFVGLFMAGVGVVPIAVLATLFHAEWSILGQLALLVLLTFGFRAWGMHLLDTAQRRTTTRASLA
jgi:hypothetical protein